jgi:hypothetical protein
MGNRIVNCLGFCNRVHRRVENGTAWLNLDERISIGLEHHADRVPFTTRYGPRRALPGTASKLRPMMLNPMLNPMLGAMQGELR